MPFGGSSILEWVERCADPRSNREVSRVRQYSGANSWVLTRRSHSHWLFSEKFTGVSIILTPPTLGGRTWPHYSSGSIDAGVGGISVFVTALAKSASTPPPACPKAGATVPKLTVVPAAPQFRNDRRPTGCLAARTAQPQRIRSARTALPRLVSHTYRRQSCLSSDRPGGRG